MAPSPHDQKRCYRCNRSHATFADCLPTLPESVDAAELVHLAELAERERGLRLPLSATGHAARMRGLPADPLAGPMREELDAMRNELDVVQRLMRDRVYVLPPHDGFAGMPRTCIGALVTVPIDIQTIMPGELVALMMSGAGFELVEVRVGTCGHHWSIVTGLQLPDDGSTLVWPLVDRRIVHPSFTIRVTLTNHGERAAVPSVTLLLREMADESPSNGYDALPPNAFRR